MRGDGTGVHSLDSAAGKAYTSATLKADTEAVVERAKTDPIIANVIAKLPNMLLEADDFTTNLGGKAKAEPDDVDPACPPSRDSFVDRHPAAVGQVASR